MEQPLVSIITITRNRGKLIGRCIQSVLNQTYKNIEHIVVDGASDDETDEVVNSFKDERLKYIKLEKNEPIVETINIGFRASLGQYITFLDSDDEYVPEKVQKQLTLIQSLPEDYGMVYCWMTYFDNNTKKVDHIHNPSVRGDVSKVVVERPVVSGTPTYMFRRNAFQSSGGWKTKEEIGIISDWELAARFCQSWKVDFVPEFLVNVYVNHNISRMSTKDFYSNYYYQKVKFHNYFLSTFKDVFNEDSRKMSYHLVSLTVCYLKLHQWKRAVSEYWKLLNLRVPFKRKLSVFYELTQNPN